jgi:(E)-4-hydroxy-3-methylbut-2-enyl-diphosphate synthase
MTNTDTRDTVSTVAQIKELASNGCDIVRLAVPDEKAASAFSEIVKQVSVPLIADIHFDWRLAIASIKAGASGVRINPGNIGSVKKTQAVAEAAMEAGVPIRVGANSGSLPDGMLEKKVKSGMEFHDAVAESLVDGALQQCKILEDCGFPNIKVSLKSSDVQITVAACRRFAEISEYPLHLGITEAGTLTRGTVKSSVGIGALLLEGIGDTIRVSLTADPLEEVKVAELILESVGLRKPYPEIVSCPTCGRTEIDLIGLAEKVERLVDEIKEKKAPLKIKKIAVMGCVVNGPGEAKDAELGITGGKGRIILFEHGRKIGTYPESEGFEAFKEELLKRI